MVDTRTGKTVPPILYRYYPPQRIQDLDSLTLRFSSPTRFNDTFDSDCHVVAREAGSLARRDAIKLHWQRRYQRASLGILCLTEDPENHLMWVNYAAQHTGFVLGFSTTDSYFSDIGAIPSEVEYVPLRPAESQGINPYVKSDDWQYEREWRCVRTFNNTESRDLSFPPDVIAEVIIGSWMARYDMAHLLDVLSGIQNAETGTPHLFEAKQDYEGWRIARAVSAKRTCTCCNGSGYVNGEL